MALPVRTDVAAIPVTQYQPGMPPYVPPLQVDPRVQIHLPEITSAAMNELGAKAYSNPTRLFAYNLYSESYWQNPRFAELVKFIADMLILGMNKGHVPSPHQGIYDAVSQSLTLLTSSLVFEYPDLKSITQPQLVDSAMQNLQVLNNLKQEISSMYQQQGKPMYPPAGYPQPNYPQPQQTQYPVPVDMYGRPIQYPPQMPQLPPGQSYPAMTDQYGRPVYQPQMQPVGQPTYPQQQPQPMGYMPQMSPVAAQQFPKQAGGRWNNATPQGQTNTFTQVPAAAPPAQDTFTRTHAKTTYPNAVIDNAADNQVAVNKVPTEADWKSSLSQPYLTNFDSNKHVRSFQLDHNNTVVETINPIGEEEMDRNQHMTVLAGLYDLDTTARQEIVGQETFNVVNVTKPLIDKTTSAPVIINDHITDTMWIDNHLEAVIVEAKFQHMLYVAKNKGCNVYTFQSVVTNPDLSLDDVSGIARNLSIATTLTSLASNMKSVAKATATMFPQNAETPTVELPGAMVYLARIDKMLTKLVNDFLVNGLSIEHLSIDSFSEDVGTLRKYLTNKYGTAYGTAFERFDKLAMASLFLPMDDAVCGRMTDNLLDDRTEGLDIHVNFIPVIYNITFVDLMDKEMGISVKPCSAEMIRQDLSPMLFHIAESIFNSDDIANQRALHNLLVTRDGEMYRLHEGYLGNDCYLVSKHDC